MKEEYSQREYSLEAGKCRARVLCKSLVTAKEARPALNCVQGALTSHREGVVEPNEKRSLQIGRGY